MSKLISPRTPTLASPALREGQEGRRRDGSAKGYTDRAQLRKSTELERWSDWIAVGGTPPPHMRAAQSHLVQRHAAPSRRFAIRAFTPVGACHWTRQRRDPIDGLWRGFGVWGVSPSSDSRRRPSPRICAKSVQIHLHPRKRVAVRAAAKCDHPKARARVRAGVRPQTPHRRRETAAGGRGLATRRARSAMSNARARACWA